LENSETPIDPMVFLQQNGIGVTSDVISSDAAIPHGNYNGLIFWSILFLNTDVSALPPGLSTVNNSLNCVFIISGFFQ
jgi:hypothetical protein